MFSKAVLFSNVKGLLSSVLCQEEIKVEGVTSLAVALQAAEGGIHSAYSVCTARSASAARGSQDSPALPATFDTASVCFDSQLKVTLQNLCRSF